MNIDVTEIIIVIIGLVFTSIVMPLLATVFKWLRSKIDNEALLTTLTEAQTIATNVVSNLQTNVVTALKVANKDGKLTADEITNIKNQATKMFLSDLSNQSYNVIRSNADDITKWVENMLEAQLFKLKTNQNY